MYLERCLSFCCEKKILPFDNDRDRSGGVVGAAVGVATCADVVQSPTPTSPGLSPTSPPHIQDYTRTSSDRISQPLATCHRLATPSLEYYQLLTKAVRDAPKPICTCHCSPPKWALTETLPTPSNIRSTALRGPRDPFHLGRTQVLAVLRKNDNVCQLLSPLLFSMPSNSMLESRGWSSVDPWHPTAQML